MAHERLEPAVQRALDDVGTALRQARRAQAVRWQAHAAEAYRADLGDAIDRLTVLRGAVESAVRPVRLLDDATARPAGLGGTTAGSSTGLLAGHTAGVCGG